MKVQHKQECNDRHRSLCDCPEPCGCHVEGYAAGKHKADFEVLVVPGRGDLVTVAGTMPGIQPGERLHLRGKWINHPIQGY